MKNLKLRKILLTICSAMLLVCLSVGATFAYLTSTATVTNTFMVGNVKITLDETDVDDSDKDGSTEDRDTANTYKLYPGQTYVKDPTIHIDDASEKAYLGLVITVSNTADADAFFAKYSITNVLDGLSTNNNRDWKVASNTVADNVRTYVLIKNTTISGSTDDIVLFKNIVVPGEATNEEIALLNDVQLGITAYAVQAEGFTSADEALHAGFSTVFPESAE